MRHEIEPFYKNDIEPFYKMLTAMATMLSKP